MRARLSSLTTVPVVTICRPLPDRSELIALSQVDLNVVSSLIKPPQGGYDRAADGQGALADRISKVVPRRGELRGVFVRTALAGRLRLPGVRPWWRGGAEEPGVHLRMLRLWPADLNHGGHGAAPCQAAADGLVLGRASDVDAFQRNVGAAVGGSARPHLYDRLAADTE